MHPDKHHEIVQAIAAYPLVMAPYGDVRPIITAAEEIAERLTEESGFDVDPVEVLAVWVESDAGP